MALNHSNFNKIENSTSWPYNLTFEPHSKQQVLMAETFEWVYAMLSSNPIDVANHAICSLTFCLFCILNHSGFRAFYNLKLK